jgi:hypothetical protein
MVHLCKPLNIQQFQPILTNVSFAPSNELMEMCHTNVYFFRIVIFFLYCRKRELRRRLTWCLKGNMYCLFGILCWKPLVQFCSSYLIEPLNPNPNMTSFRKDVYLKKMWLDQCASIMALECQATLELQIKANIAQLVISISHWWLEEWW